jgi:branched-chain amino acid aminotransferase
MTTLWVNGRLVDPDEPAVSAMDHGLLLGDGLYETLLVRDGTPTAFDRHLARLAHGAQAMGIDVDLDGVVAGVDAVVAAATTREAPGALRLRITVTAGQGPLAPVRGSQTPTVVIAAAPQPPVPSSARVVVAPWVRNERAALAGVKCTSGAENRAVLTWARAQGADEAIVANTRGELCEGTSSNVFVSVDGRLVTPPLASGCLPGVTRAIVLEHVDVEERPLPVDAIGRAGEAFLTSAIRGVQPIATVDGVALPACPGPHTQEAADALAAALSEGAPRRPR